MRSLDPVRAELRWRGVAAERRHADAEPIAPIYEEVAPGGPFGRIAEPTTAPGSVLAQLFENEVNRAAEDGDRARGTSPDAGVPRGLANPGLVVFANGDEIALDFDATALPPPAPGMTRTWFLVSTGYARDGDPNTEPLAWPVTAGKP